MRVLGEYLSGNQHEIGQREPTSHWLNLVKQFSRFHLCAMAGDSVAMCRVLLGRCRGFHNINPAGLSVRQVRTLLLCMEPHHKHNNR